MNSCVIGAYPPDQDGASPAIGVTQLLFKANPVHVNVVAFIMSDNQIVDA